MKKVLVLPTKRRETVVYNYTKKIARKNEMFIKAVLFCVVSVLVSQASASLFSNFKLKLKHFGKPSFTKPVEENKLKSLFPTSKLKKFNKHAATPEDNDFFFVPDYRWTNYFNNVPPFYNFYHEEPPANSYPNIYQTYNPYAEQQNLNQQELQEQSQFEKLIENQYKTYIDQVSQQQLHAAAQNYPIDFNFGDLIIEQPKIRDIRENEPEILEFVEDIGAEPKGVVKREKNKQQVIEVVENVQKIESQETQKDQKQPMETLLEQVKMTMRPNKENEKYIKDYFKKTPRTIQFEEEPGYYYVILKEKIKDGEGNKNNSSGAGEMTEEKKETKEEADTKKKVEEENKVKSTPHYFETVLKPEVFNIPNDLMGQIKSQMGYFVENSQMLINEDKMKNKPDIKVKVWYEVM